MGVHDYYYIALLILVVAILTPFIWLLKTNYKQLSENIVLRILVSAFLVYNFLYALELTKLRTLSREINLVGAGNTQFKDRMKYLNYANEQCIRFEDMKPYLAGIGVEETDRIISPSDPSFNVSLYLMNHKGWTAYFDCDKKENIELLIKKGAKFMVISDPKTLEKESLQTFITEPIGEFKGIQVFKLKN